MTDYASVAPRHRVRLTGWRMDVCAVLCAMLAVVAFQAIQGFPTLADSNGDNDSLLRLVEVRDLLAGQGWFDLHQYRMGTEGGFVMHWSRLVDAPIAAMIVALTGLTGSVGLAEAITRIAWPLLLFGLTLFFVVRSARILGDESVVLPAVVVGAPTLYFIGIYQPGALDHHNVQLMLTMASLFLLLDAPTNRWAALFSGVCAGLMLAVEESGDDGMTGVVHRIDSAAIESETSILWMREMLSGAYAPTWIDAETDRGRVRAFVMNKAHPRYAGALTIAEQARRIAAAAGETGVNRDYLYRCRGELRRMGVEDPYVEALFCAVTEITGEPGDPLFFGGSPA